MKMRLAMRREGDWWNAYVAQEGTMDGAKLIGSILIGIVENNDKRRRAFLDLMRDGFADGLERLTGQRPEDMDEHPAPESERSGRG